MGQLLSMMGYLGKFFQDLCGILTKYFHVQSNLCQNVEISVYFKKFSFALQTTFSRHNLKADNFFSQLQLANNFFYRKGNPPIKIMVLPLVDTLDSKRTNIGVQGFWLWASALI